jgi:hypothetical protein
MKSWLIVSLGGARIVEQHRRVQRVPSPRPLAAPPSARSSGPDPKQTSAPTLTLTTASHQPRVK